MSLAKTFLKGMKSNRFSRFMPDSLRDFIIPRLAHRLAYSEYKAAMQGRTANCASIIDRLKATYKPIACPLVLISQVQRSGGSLLSQLFDGHSELLAHPQELKIGYPTKGVWPPIDSSLSVDKQFEILFELKTINMCRSGYAKEQNATFKHNFFLMPRMQRELFRRVVADMRRSAPRDVLDAYFTSYFNSWLNLRSPIEKAKFVTGFVPTMVNRQENMDYFWNAYPDGYLIAVIRSPHSWYPSAARLSKTKFPSLEEAATCWLSSTEAIFREKQRGKSRVIVLHFDDLVTNTESTMRLICDRLGILFEPILLSPTFNGEPMGANTSFDQLKRGRISSAPVNRGRHLSEADRSYLETHCMPLYERALEEIVETLPRQKARSV